MNIRALAIAAAVALSLTPAAKAAFFFDIVVNNTGAAFTPSEQAAFDDAETLWESLITGYQDRAASFSLMIDAEITAIDGPGMVLGSAGPNTVLLSDSGTFLSPDTGTMTFDSADTAALGPAFSEVVLHEMGHVLGIGTLWDTTGIVPGTQQVYVDGSGQYTGAFGLAAYQAEFDAGATFVPVELGGGPGTADGHWNEVDGGAGPTGFVSSISGQDLRNELMTGWLNSPTFISSLTVESLRDIGYTVNSASPAVIPEPSTYGLLAAVLLVGIASRRRRRNHGSVNQ